MIFLSFQILNTKVIFSGRITEIGAVGPKSLTFNKVDINVGEAFDGSIFTAPISGIYKMTFSGQSGFQIEIVVENNNKEVFHIIGGKKVEYIIDPYDLNNVSYTWMMKLVEGDKVKLFTHNTLYATNDMPLTFTGELIHIEN